MTHKESLRLAIANARRMAANMPTVVAQLLEHAATMERRLPTMSEADAEIAVRSLRDACPALLRDGKKEN